VVWYYMLYVCVCVCVVSNMFSQIHQAIK
jgi:hypothetical protein